MKRTPIHRRKPFGSGPKRLARKKRMRRMSSKRRAQNEVRREVLVRLVEERGDTCQAGVPSQCEGRAVDGHERLRRGQGGDPTEPANIVLVCRPCHDWIHNNIKAAVACGLLSRSWEAT